MTYPFNSGDKNYLDICRNETHWRDIIAYGKCEKCSKTFMVSKKQKDRELVLEAQRLTQHND